MTISCGGDSTSPDKTHQDPLVVTLAATAAGGPIMSDSPNGPIITCNINLTATATGTGHATWGDATATWYVGKDRTNNSVGTTTNASDEVVEGFSGASGIRGGASQQATWYFYDYEPFTISIAFSYNTDDGRTGLATARFTCGPDPATAVRPTITLLSLPSTTGPLKTGDTVSVHYQAASSSGIWVSIVQAGGAFVAHQIVGERLAPSVDHTVNFVVPATNPGVPLTLSLIVADAALEGATQTLATQLKFVDSVPPTITSAVLSGQYAVGDTFAISATAKDDNALGWLVYQIGAPANVMDSVQAVPDSASETMTARMVVPPAWVGTPTVTVVVRDAAGLTSQPVTSAPDSVRFYPLVSHPTTTPLTVSQAPARDMVYDAKRDLMYIGGGDGRIVAIAPSTMTQQWAVMTPDVPYGMDLSLSGDSLLVAVPVMNQIYVYNMTNPSVPPGTIRLSVLDTAHLASNTPSPAPSGLRVLANGHMLVTLTQPIWNFTSVVDVDLASGAQTIRSDSYPWGNTAEFWHVMSRPADRSRVIAFGTCWGQYLLDRDVFLPCQPQAGHGTTSTAFSFDSTGTYATYASGVWNLATNEIWWAPHIDQQAPNIAISPDASVIYMAAGQDLRMMRWSDKTMLERTPLPLAADRLVVAPNGKWILAFQTSSPARVSRIDLP